MELVILSDTELAGFMALINSYLADGWSLDGDFKIISDGSDRTFYQAMTRIIEGV